MKSGHMPFGMRGIICLVAPSAYPICLRVSFEAKNLDYTIHSLD
jgi:hypothetical protein